MALTIEWSSEANLGLEHVLDYLEIKWTILEILNLEHKIDGKLKQISEYPLSCPAAATNPSLRKAVIDKNNFIIYRVNSAENLIHILSFDSTRRE